MNIPESLLDKIVADSAVAYDCHCIQDVHRFEIKNPICDKSNCRFRKGIVAAIESLEETHNITEKSASDNSYLIANTSVRTGTSFCSKSFVIKEGEIHEVKIGDSVIATVTISKSEGGSILHSSAGGGGSWDPPKGGIGGPGWFGITPGMTTNGPAEQHSESSGDDTKNLSITINGIGDGMGGLGRQPSDSGGGSGASSTSVRISTGGIGHPGSMPLAVGNIIYLPIKFKWWERFIPNNWGRKHKKKKYIITSVTPGD